MMVFYVKAFWKQAELILEDFLSSLKKENQFIFPFIGGLKITYSEKHMKSLWELKGNPYL